MKRKASKRGKTAKKATRPSQSAFEDAASDAAFRMPSKKRGKVRVDSRFAEMLDEDFLESDIPRVDARGNAVDVAQAAAAARAELEEHYDFGDLRKAARGEVDLLESSDEEEFASEEEVVYEEEEAPEGVVVGKRLAILHCDWDHMRCLDLLSVLRSFCPASGKVKWVEIRVSKFGAERLAMEEKYGPDVDFHRDDGSEDSAEEPPARTTASEGAEFHTEKLRKYEKDKLKYYFAVAKCDCPATAYAIYDSIDGVEFLKSSVRLDVRVIPDPPANWKRSEEGVAERELRAAPIKEQKVKRVPTDYRPTAFINAALQATKVKLTWDEPELVRQKLHSWEDKPKEYGEVLARRGKQVSEAELERFLAPPVDDEEAEASKDTERARYAQLMAALDERASGEAPTGAKSVILEFSSDEEEEAVPTKKAKTKKDRIAERRRKRRTALEKIDDADVGPIDSKDARFAAADPDYHKDPTRGK